MFNIMKPQMKDPDATEKLLKEKGYIDDKDYPGNNLTSP